MLSAGAAPPPGTSWPNHLISWVNKVKGKKKKKKMTPLKRAQHELAMRDQKHIYDENHLQPGDGGAAQCRAKINWMRQRRRKKIWRVTFLLFDSSPEFWLLCESELKRFFSSYYLAYPKFWYLFGRRDGDGVGMHNGCFFFFALEKVVCFGSNGTLNVFWWEKKQIMCRGFAVVNLRFGSGSITGEYV